MFPVRYELGFYTPEDGILHSHRLENLKSYIVFLIYLLDLGGTGSTIIGAIYWPSVPTLDDRWW
jgi:hypothetical protein